MEIILDILLIRNRSCMYGKAEDQKNDYSDWSVALLFGKHCSVFFYPIFENTH